MQTLRIRVGKKGQITLPQRLRKRWGLDEGAEIVMTAGEDHAVLRPVRRTRVKDGAGALGRADPDEVEFAILDPELVFQHYSKKYPR